MNLKSLSFLALLAGGASVALASTQVGISLQIGAPAPVIVHRAPPRHAVEVATRPPGVGFVWVAGHYVWTSADWAWVPGAWVQPPQPNTVWIAGRWDPISQNWLAGYWEVPHRAVVVTPAAEVVIRTAPPALRQEVRGHRPGRNYVWVGGYWAWQGGHHVWITGRWAVPPHRHAVWEQPRWERRGGTYVFIAGRWR